MSPEQARGQEVDKRSDIWAFGCVLYEALCGRKPFDGDTVADVLGAIVKTEPDWDRLPDSTPLKIRELLHRCLRKDSRHRLRDIGDAWVDLEEAAAADDVAATLPRLQSGTPQLTRTAVVAIIIAVTAAGIALWALTRPRARDARTVTRSVIPLAPDQALDLTGTASLAISPDGGLVAYVARSGSARELYLRAIDQLEGHPVDGARGARMPFFSPDGQWIGFHANAKLLKASIRGGAPVTIVEIGNNYTGASWGADGRIVYAAQNAIGLWRVSADGGAAEVLTLPDRERREHKHRFPEILPGGKAVLFTLVSADITSMDDASIAVVSLETGEYHVVSEGGTDARFSSSGHLVCARAGSPGRPVRSG